MACRPPRARAAPRGLLQRSDEQAEGESNVVGSNANGNLREGEKQGRKQNSNLENVQPPPGQQ